MRNSTTVPFLLALVLIASACGPAPETETTATGGAATVAVAASTEPAAAVEPTTTADLGAVPSWQMVELMNAVGAAPFTLTDFRGKTVYVETFATWCGECREQLGNVQGARKELGEEAVFVALSLEPDIADEALKTYAEEAGFDWVFAAMPPEMITDMAAAFGQAITVPSSTPHFLIRPDGSTTELITGYEDPSEIVESIRSAQQGQG